MTSQQEQATEESRSVFVTRQPGGHDAVIEVPLSELSGLKAGTRSGGYREGHFYPELYAYMSCDLIPEGSGFGHSGSHGRCPHSIRVCVVGSPDESLYRSLCEKYDVREPAEQERANDRKRVKEEILSRFNAEEAADGELRTPKGGPHVFCHAVEQEAGPLIQAWAGEADWTSWYFDHETGEVFLDAGDPDVLPEAFNDWRERLLDADLGDRPHLPERFEELSTLSDGEVDLLTIEDLREIRDAFLASRGFKPQSED